MYAAERESPQNLMRESSLDLSSEINIGKSLDPCHDRIEHLTMSINGRGHKHAKVHLLLF